MAKRSKAKASGGKDDLGRQLRVPPKPHRRLRVYALDPSIGKRLDSIAVNETTLSVAWEPNLKPGPVGEYLEVVDVDPASDRIYEPVDLNRAEILAQDGWPPSEGNPQFHQQMVYAVGMTTINNFEKALGRKALWATKEDNTMVQRLRIYPHALRTENAYYSPDKKALLFGYFPSNSVEGDAISSGSMVFACLSSDIVAHEMTHALLDGMHRRFEEASNPDVPAFHEGFADIVALFQHFTIPELVSFEIARLRGNLMKDGLLGGLANQFGQASGLRGPLRNYAKADPDKLHYPDVTDAHDRGSILVYAIYDAFRAIVDRRTRDLIRLATGGTGILPSGAIHPDLVHRLTEETCKTARHVCRMCIRALDYCPPVDITFGDYLRAIVTSDLDAVENDRYGYRVAFMEAFRKWNILPKDVRTISEQTLAWNTPTRQNPNWLRHLVTDEEHKAKYPDRVVVRWNREPNRSEIFELNRDNCRRLERRLKNAFARDAGLYPELGLRKGVPAYDEKGKPRRSGKPRSSSTFEVQSVRLARRITPDGEQKTNLIVAVTQRRKISLDRKDADGDFFWFRGGATLIIDTHAGEEAICYAIIKNSGNGGRLDSQREFIAKGAANSLRALYFGGGKPGAAEPFALLHASREDRNDEWNDG